jgi:mitochondrial enoyl-[acyl-carrier protein] reductase / trans-2-enoyl-CoA reductase
MNSRNVILSAFGKPETAAQLQTSSMAAPAPSMGEISLRTRFAPINPADLNVMEGTYGTLPSLPAPIGNEAAGIVTAVGSNVEHIHIGDPVMPLSAGGLWQEHLTLPATSVLPLPHGIDLAQASMLRVNPATAWLMLTKYRQLQPGEWIIQNAANSAVGLSVIQLARTAGWRVLSLVRRPAAAAQCRAHGAEHVICEDDPDWKTQAMTMLGNERARLALNAVGGDSALRLTHFLADEACHLTYGAMSRQKVTIPNRYLIFQNITFTGFWLSRWMRQADPCEISTLYHFLAQHILTGTLHLPIEKIYPITELTAAITAAQASQRSGKILLSWL